MASACSIRVRGVVQGVGFRPFVYRLARANTLAGWVLNGEEGVEIYLEGAEQGLQAFVQDLKTQPPPAASIADIEVHARGPDWLERIHDPRKPAAGAANGSHFPRSCLSAMLALKNFSIQRIRAIGIRTSTARTVGRVTQLFLACPTTVRTLRCSTGLWTTTATRNITIQEIAVSMRNRSLARSADPSYSLHSES